MLELSKLGRSFKMLVFLRYSLSFCTCTTLKIFRNAVCVYALILFLAYLLRKRVCIPSRNVNTKFCCHTRTKFAASRHMPM